MERFLQYLDEVDDVVYSVPLLWEAMRRLLARLLALLAGILAGAALAFAAVTMPLAVAVLLTAGVIGVIVALLRRPVSRWTARHS